MSSSEEKLKTQDDDEYCRALAWALYTGECPETVGLYVPWGRCEDALLDNIKEHLCRLSSKNSTNGNKNVTVNELFKLLFLMVFYNPVITKKHEEQQRRHIYIEFSALHCIGCDRLWAGLITTLCDGIEDEFGRIPISIYRALYKEKGSRDETKSKKWVPKKILHIPVWFVTLFVFLFLVCALLLKYLLFDKLGESEQYEVITEYMLYTSVTLFGTYSLLLSGTALKVIRNYTVTQKGKLMNKLKRTDMSSQLGFMNDVKKEIEIITSYLQMMEMNQNQSIRVIIEITKLDKCLPDRVVEVLHAINILLSNPDAPFISILAVDPGIIVECVEKSDLLKGMSNNGYLFLNQFVTLPFSVPQMNKTTKSKHLNKIIEGKNINEDENTPTGKTENDKEKSSENYPFFMVDIDTKNQDPHGFLQETKEDTNILIYEIKEALNSLNSEEFHKHKYIIGNVINMKRIVNTIVITVRLMIKDEMWENIRPKVSKWVIMAAQWPCSLSWILQCIEDEQQSGKFKNIPDTYLKKQLWDIYKTSLEALYANRESFKQLLELDGDLDIFCNLLENSNFTVEDANTLRAYTVNLDHTIQRKIELLQGSFNFLRLKKDKAVTRMALLDMDTSAVCKEIEELNIIPPERCKDYSEQIKHHNLNGKALLYTDNNEIREALKMNLGDWVEFRAAFLSLPTPNLFF